jgi:hypothetical protein
VVPDPVPNLLQPSVELRLALPPCELGWLDCGVRKLPLLDWLWVGLTALWPAPPVGSENLRHPLLPVTVELLAGAFPLDWRGPPIASVFRFPAGPLLLTAEDRWPLNVLRVI